jgi:serine/threonine protein kinase
MRPLPPNDAVRIGRYELEGTLGSGGMGTVYFGRSPGGRPAAIKVINHGYLTHPDALARFRREADMLRTLRSAYTAALIDCELSVAPYWMATEYIPGPTLSAAVKEEGPFVPEACIRMLAALAEGLSDIHRHGVCHRDLKPQNVILSATGPQLIDFGIARGLEQSGLTLTGITMGTPGYIAPELMDSNDLTPAADVFALGSSLAYAATGRKPYGEGTLESVYLRLIREDIDLVGVEPGLADLIRWCVAKDRAARPSPGQIIECCRRWRSANAPSRSAAHPAAPPRSVPDSFRPPGAFPQADPAFRTGSPLVGGQVAYRDPTPSAAAFSAPAVATQPAADGTGFPPGDAVPGSGISGNGFPGNGARGNGVPGGGIPPGDAVPPADPGKHPQRLTRIVVAGLVVLAVLAVLAVLGFAVYELNGGAARHAEQAATQLSA